MNNILPINKVICGDAIEQLKIFPDNYFDSIVTDPPAGISFMGKQWDADKGGRNAWINWLSNIFIEARRSLKPGGHALVWALPRTSHWTATALEDAGFEIRDCIYHVFGSGFPKSMDISKQIDKQAGAEREVIGKYQRPDGTDRIYENWSSKEEEHLFDTSSKVVTTPSTPEAKQWSGWGTALKPAVECWWLVKKPLSEKTVAENVLRWGVGGINIDGSRVPFKNTSDYNEVVNNYKGGIERATNSKETWKLHGGGWKLGEGIEIPDETKGRFPANLIHDGSDEVINMFPNTKSGAMTKPYKYTNNGFSLGKPTGETKQIHDANEGSASRFFYCAKPSRSERDAGLQNIKEKIMGHNRFDKCAICGGYILQNPDRPSACRCAKPVRKDNAMKGNHHPTVKSQALMEYLIKLITPPNSIGLDMFAGSGSTLIAYKKLGHQYIGIEIDPEYCKIAEQRLIADLNGNRSLDAYNEYEPK
jgi:DNA modification methylase